MTRCALSKSCHSSFPGHGGRLGRSSAGAPSLVSPAFPGHGGRPRPLLRWRSVARTSAFPGHGGRPGRSSAGAPSLDVTSQPSRFAGEVGEDHVGAGALDRGEVLEGDGVAVDPPALGGGLDHRVLAGHVVGGDGQVGLRPGGGDHIEVGEGRLHHDQVGAFLDVGADLGQRLTRVARVLLVALAVATAHDGDVDGVAEGPVERGGVLGGVGEDRGAHVPGAVERAADGCDLPVHHPARRGDVGAGFGLRDRSSLVDLEGGVVVDVAVGPDDAAVPVVGVLVDAQVGDEHHLVADLAAKVGEGELHDAGRIPRP